METAKYKGQGKRMAIKDRAGLFVWAHTEDTERQAALDILSAIVTDHAEELVNTFYATFLAHEEGSAFLSHAVVNQRLSLSLRGWLLDLMQADPHQDLTAFDARQVKIGEIHARLKIPNQLVMAGMTLLKSAIAMRVVERQRCPRAATTTIMLLGELIDYAMRLMTAAYVLDTSRRVQTDEAFRLFSLGQDINLERETQRAALMEWSQSVLFGLLGHGTNAAARPLAVSPFGLWVRHRASVMFQGSSILGKIEALMNEIDSTVLGVVGKQPDGIAELQRCIDEIKYLLNDLFQAAANVENGRDPLTRALNRRFLPSVLGREVSLATSSRTPLSLLMADIDHFKSINDRHGHTSGDLALTHIAEILLSSVRASDFVFRYGGEEFLIVLVETDADEAARIAERIRRAVEGQSNRRSHRASRDSLDRRRQPRGPPRLPVPHQRRRSGPVRGETARPEPGGGGTGRRHGLGLRREPQRARCGGSFAPPPRSGCRPRRAVGLPHRRRPAGRQFAAGETSAS